MTLKKQRNYRDPQSISGLYRKPGIDLGADKRVYAHLKRTSRSGVVEYDCGEAAAFLFRDQSMHYVVCI